MAKKKKSVSANRNIYSIIALLLGVVALAMLFLAAVKVPDKTVLGTTIEGESLTGLQVAFGYSENDVQCLSFSILALLPWVLIIVGIITSILATTSKKSSRLLSILSLILFAGAAVLLFLMPGFMLFAETYAGAILEVLTWNLGIGSIIAGSCCALASIVSLVKAL